MPLLGEIQGWLYSTATAELKAVAAGVDTPKLAFAMAVAAVFGMLHALMPGHGKTVIVSYYLGRPAHPLASVATSAILVLTHVGSAIVLVLAGVTVIRRTIGGAGRAPEIEIASAMLIIAVGLWLLFQAVRPVAHEHTVTDGRMLAFVTGLVPCPLTTFVMVYATTQGIIAAGLLITASMAIGMTVTIAVFALAAVLLRDRLQVLLNRTEHTRRRLGRGLEMISAAAIMGCGAWMLATR